MAVRQWGERRWDRLARYAIAGGAIVRALWVLVLHPPPDNVYSDAQSYVESAMRLARWAPPEHFDAFYPPGMRFILSLPLAVLGADRDGLVAAAIFWVILSALTPYFVWRFTRLILTPAAAALAAVLCAFWPIHIAYAGYFMSETPALTFLVLSLWLAERAYRMRSHGDGLVAGVVGGLAAATRPALVLNIVVAAWPLLRRLRAHWRAFAGLAVGVLAVGALVVAPNSLVVGHIDRVSENSRLTFYLGHCDVNTVRTGPAGGPGFTFATPVATQLHRGRNVSLPNVEIWDQSFFYEQGFACIAADAVGHVRTLVRNIFDMGLSTIPWPPSNDPGVRDVTNLANVAYVLALPFIVVGSLRLIRRRRLVGAGRGETTLLVHLSLVLVTAIVYFGDPRFRTPYDVFGLALLGSLLADRFFDPLEGWSAWDPRVRADDAVEQHDEGVLRRDRALGEIDADETHATEPDGRPPVPGNDHPTQDGGTLKRDEPVPTEVLGGVGSDV